jgi:hypothetical protein
MTFIRSLTTLTGPYLGGPFLADIAKSAMSDFFPIGMRSQRGINRAFSFATITPCLRVAKLSVTPFLYTQVRISGEDLTAINSVVYSNTSGCREGPLKPTSTAAALRLPHRRPSR